MIIVVCVKPALVNKIGNNLGLVYPPNTSNLILEILHSGDIIKKDLVQNFFLEAEHYKTQHSFFNINSKRLRFVTP